jgi:AcrR family transcriptional regulator
MGKISSPANTQRRILDAAEALFAAAGFAASLRAITTRAGVNLAAINYHFGSKEALIREVFARRLGPLNRERLALLDRCEAAERAGAPDLEAVLTAFIAPSLRVSRDPARGGAVFMHLLGRIHAETDARLRLAFGQPFRDLGHRFIAALNRALPHLTPPELFWRFHFTIGAMSHTMAASYRLTEQSCGHHRHADIEEAIRHLVAFVAAGLRAPIPVSAPAPSAQGPSP